MDLQVLKSIARLSNTDEGQDLLEYLEEVETNCVKQVAYCDPSLREMNAGRLQLAKEIKDFILSAESKCKEQTKDIPAEWSL